MDFQQLILNKERRWQRNLVIMSVVLVLLSTIHLMVGEVFLSPFQSLSVFEQKLLLDLRLPRLVAAAMIGAALAVSGATLQVLLGECAGRAGRAWHFWGRKFGDGFGDVCIACAANAYDLYAGGDSWLDVVHADIGWYCSGDASHDSAFTVSRCRVGYFIQCHRDMGFLLQ